jgi:hypothetical protein
MRNRGKVLVGALSGVIALVSVVIWAASGSKADDGNRCPATSNSSCSGLILEKLGV